MSDDGGGGEVFLWINLNWKMAGKELCFWQNQTEIGKTGKHTTNRIE